LLWLLVVGVLSQVLGLYKGSGSDSAHVREWGEIGASTFMPSEQGQPVN
jgi:hypothetical protein